MEFTIREGWFRPASDVPLWRYLDMTRFALLLAERELYFSRLTLVDGPSESELPDTTYISCWHQHPTESMATWEVYASRGAEVALKTTVDRLQYALKGSDTEVTVGKVAYRDFALTGEPVSRADLDGLVLYKRPAYGHEAEVRLYTSLPMRQMRAGLGVAVDVADLLGEVIVSPRASEATLRAVRALAITYAPRLPVRPSSLLDVAR